MASYASSGRSPGSAKAMLARLRVREVNTAYTFARLLQRVLIYTLALPPDSPQLDAITHGIFDEGRSRVRACVRFIYIFSS